jgi:hypothetical protein
MHDETTPPLADSSPDEAYDMGWITGYDKARADSAPLEPGHIADLTRALLDPDLKHGTIALLAEVERRRRRASLLFWGWPWFGAVREDRERARTEYDEAYRGAHAYDRLVAVVEKITGQRA